MTICLCNYKENGLPGWQVPGILVIIIIINSWLAAGAEKDNY